MEILCFKNVLSYSIKKENTILQEQVLSVGKYVKEQESNINLIPCFDHVAIF